MSEHSYETDHDSGDMTTQPASAHDTDNVPEPAISPAPGDAEPAETADTEPIDAETSNDTQEGRELREV